MARAEAAVADADSAAAGRGHDPEGVKRDILQVATAIFSEKGYSGARVDEIAQRTATSKRMLYYYFGDKEGLFIAVLEEAYARIRGIEQQLDLEGLAPPQALVRLTEFTFDYHTAHQDFVRLVMVENIHHAQHLVRSERIRNLNSSVIRMLGEVYRRGVASGAFRSGLDITDLHMTISALCFYNVSNRYSFSHIFNRDMQSDEALARRRAVTADTVLRYTLA